MSATTRRFAIPTELGRIRSPKVCRPIRTRVFPSILGSAMNRSGPSGVPTTAVTTGSEVASSSNSNDSSSVRHTG